MSTELHEKLQEALGGVYVLERELGGGGMSRVFLARDDALSRRIVVKLLPPEMAAAVNIERFRREIQLAASLMHPHLIPLLSAGEVLGLPYFTMPYIEGESLRARLGEESTALDYLESACEERVGWMLLLGREPALDVLRETPRFQALMRKIGPADTRRSGPTARVSREAKRV